METKQIKSRREYSSPTTETLRLITNGGILNSSPNGGLQNMDVNNVIAAEDF